MPKIAQMARRYDLGNPSSSLSQQNKDSRLKVLIVLLRQQKIFFPTGIICMFENCLSRQMWTRWKESGEGPLRNSCNKLWDWNIISCCATTKIRSVKIFVTLIIIQIEKISVKMPVNFADVKTWKINWHKSILRLRKTFTGWGSSN